jgi:hypothetical protein
LTPFHRPLGQVPELLEAGAPRRHRRTYIRSLERYVYTAGIDVVDSLAKMLGVKASYLLKRPERGASRRRSSTGK